MLCLAFGLLRLPPSHLDSSDLSTCWEYSIASAWLLTGLGNAELDSWNLDVLSEHPDLSPSFLGLRSVPRVTLSLDFDCFFSPYYFLPTLTLACLGSHLSPLSPKGNPVCSIGRLLSSVSSGSQDWSGSRLFEPVHLLSLVLF